MRSVLFPPRRFPLITGFPLILSLLLVIGFGLIGPPAGAGTIHPRLRSKMNAIPPGGAVSVIVNLAEQAPIAALNQELSARKATRLERNRAVLEALQRARLSQAGLRESLDQELRSGGVLGYTSYWISNLMVVQALPAVIEAIASRPDVGLVEPNFTFSLITPVGNPRTGTQDRDEAGPPKTRGIGVTPGLRAIRAPEVWYQLGYNGAGRLIGSLDTGVDGNHPALNTRWRGYQGANPWQECWLDVLGTNTHFPVDEHGHGTHTTGTMTGLGAATEDTIGVAWGAKWIAGNGIYQDPGVGFDNDVLTCFQWFTNPDGDLSTVDDVPDVVQNSWGINEGFSSNPPYTDCDTRWWSVIDNCEAAGVCVTWSAGNEGSGGEETLRSPADRASSLTNAFSIGAVNATGFGWPYPIATWSSRGPSGCDGPAELRTKPEVVAPGVSVYSSVPGGGYQQDGWDGTSMAGPHVAGTVALMRQANPDIDVETIKQILMDTARDEGETGEDNTYGWGFIDAYAAVVAATAGYGDLQGHVHNASWSGVPIPGARVRLIETGVTFLADGDGFYSGRTGAATYTAEAGAPGFESASTSVVLTENQITVQDFSLTDIAGPAITNVTRPGSIPQTSLPFAVTATVQDYSTVTRVDLYYRVSAGPWNSMAMSALGGGLYQAALPVLPAGSIVDYYVRAVDGLSLVSTDPSGAPEHFYTAYVTELIYANTGEDPADLQWILGVLGDLANSGRWVRDNPVGTIHDGIPFQTEHDHTPAPGVKCFVTANGSEGGQPGDADVDHGCTTLQSPVFDLHTASQCFVAYWRWYAEAGNSIDDEFAVDVSSDGGSTWVPLERVPDMVNAWTKVAIELSGVINLTDQVVFRFMACDNNVQGLVEAAVDDFSLERFTPDQTSNSGDEPTRARPGLSQNQPNPFSPEEARTTIAFRLSNPADSRLEIFDPSGRVVRTLVDGPLASGSHHLAWDGRDDLGRPVGAGVYFYRLKAGAFEQSRRMTLLK